MTPSVALGLLSVLALLGAIYGARRYRTPLNPLTIFCATDIGLFTIGSGVVNAALVPDPPYPPEAVVMTALVAVVYLLGALTAYFVPIAGPRRLYHRVLSVLGLSSERTGRRYSVLKLGLIVACFLLAFFALMAMSGAGLMWITNPREAYLKHREGAGVFYAATQWFLALALIYYLWARRPRGWALLCAVGAASVVTYFMGSKNNILTLAVIGLAYQHFCVKPIPGTVYLVLAPLGTLAALALIVAQGSYTSLFESLIYFKDYFDTTARFLARFNEFGFMYGQGWLSSLWFFVPRAIYPGKPYEYGALLIHRVLFPGAAEQGYTPGYLTWTLSYLDFGVVGVFVEGLVTGVWQRTAYEYFLRHRASLFAFILMIHFAIWPVWTFTRLPSLVPLLLLFAVLFRLRVATRPTLRAPSAEPAA